MTHGAGEAAGAGRGPVSIAGREIGPLFARLSEALAESVLAERERWFLWLPVAMGIGVALYFALLGEPAVWVGPLALAAAVAVIGGGWRRQGLRFAAIALAAVALGFCIAQWRANRVAAPVLDGRVGPVVVSGQVGTVEARAKDIRVVIRRPRVGELEPDRTPHLVRVTVRTQGHRPRPGEWISVRAVLMPPPPPAAPGAFDFPRQAWFKRLGAVGFAVGKIELTPEAGEGGTFNLWLDGRRLDIADRVRARLDPETGSVAAALMTGNRGAIPDDVVTALRDAGLAHLLAISGLHVGLIAASLFAAVRGLLALWPVVALRFPIKKWAAAATLAGTFAYLLLTGATIPTQRAFLMTGLVLVAIMLDRVAISMTLVAWAALTVLLLSPESVLGPSFQMSFAAVVALIATYEFVRARFGEWRPRASIVRRALVYLVGVGLTTLIAGLATAPYAAFHFNRFVDYGLAANLTAVPVTALWIMPWSVAAYALMPFGLEGLALAPMGWGIEAVIAIARTVAGWPGSVTLLPVMPVASLVAITLGGLWLCLWRRRWRLAGLAGFLAGAAIMAAAPAPDVLIAGDARLFAVRDGAGDLILSSKRARGMTAETWLRRHGPGSSAPLPGPNDKGDAGLRCDSLGCVYRARGHVVAIARDTLALAEDCALAGVVVSLVPIRGGCPSAHTVIDRFDLWREGAHALWLDEGAVRVSTVADRRGVRPWAPRKRPRE